MPPLTNPYGQGQPQIAIEGGQSMLRNLDEGQKLGGKIYYDRRLK